MRITSIAEAWGMAGLSGLPRTLLDFLSQMYLVNGLLTLNTKLAADAAKHMILPAIVLATVPMSVIARMTRSSLLEVMNLDYMRTARGKGLNERTVVFRHAMRNALLPVVTIIGLSLGGLLSGAILTETIFGLTGVGKTLFEAISSTRLRRDPGLHTGHCLHLCPRQPAGRYFALDPRQRS